MTRDSSIWTFMFIAAVASFLLANTSMVTDAFPNLGPTFFPRVKFYGAIAGFVAGYLKMSPLDLSIDGKLKASFGHPLTTLGKLFKRAPDA